MMALVLDASVALKFVVREHDTEIARRLLKIPDPLIAPDWLLAEAASVLWRKVKRSELLAVHAERHLEELPEYFQQMFPAAELVGDALKWGLRLRHSVYDCLYFALALRQKSVLVTADEDLVRAIDRGGMREHVRLLSSFA